jgi:hypothetical protein
LRDQLRAEILEELRGELGLLPDGYERRKPDEEEDEPRRIKDFVDGEYDEAFEAEAVEINDLDEDTGSDGVVEGTYSEDDTEPVG